MNKFLTSDGYLLRKVDDKWTDGDLVFASGSDGLPVDEAGERLEQFDDSDMSPGGKK